MKNLVICIPHWAHSIERTHYLARQLSSLQQHLVGWCGYETIVSVLPGSEELDNITRIMLLGYSNLEVFHQSAHFGISEHIELLKDLADPHLALVLQDDWILMRWLDLQPHIAFMANHPEVALLHLAFTHGMTVEEVNDPSWNGYRRVMLETPYVYNDHPAIHSPLLREKAGRMKSPIKQPHLGEAVYNQIVRALVENNKLQIASLPLDELSPANRLWRHIGQTSTIKRPR